MSHQVQMPQLGESVTEGTITRWLKQVGDHVEVDEPLVEVSTDKVDTEIPSPFAGTLQRILAAEDETVAVGADLAVIGDGSDGGDGAGGDAAAAGEPSAVPDAPLPDAPAADAPAQAAPEPVAAAGSATAAPGQSADGPAGGADGATDITMPALGESVTEGTITRWLVRVGDTVAVDQPILEVSTDKVDTEIPSPVAGVVREIVAAEDETAAVGAVLARIGGAGSGTGGEAGAGSDAAPAEAPDARPAPQP
ncbi:MAG: biotin/lipoyl-containing protein, partial [Kineosporiaceae bacterium]